MSEGTFDAGEVAHRIDWRVSRNDAAVEEHGEELQESVEVKENENFFAPYRGVSKEQVVSLGWTAKGRERADFERTWNTIMATMKRATTCMNSTAVRGGLSVLLISSRASGDQGKRTWLENDVACQIDISRVAHRLQA